MHEEEEGAAVEKMELLVGDVRGKVAILVDDMVDTGHTVRLAAGVLQDAGASAVYALISHGKTLLSGIRLRELTRRSVERNHHGEPQRSPRREAHRKLLNI